jgi:NAD(P)H-dependent FMN reductase
MVTILGLCGSLRAASYNAGLLRAAAELAPVGCRVELGSIRDIPLYDADVDARGQPAAVTALKERIAASQGVLLATPEYNNSVPGVLKNALDWASRPPADIGRVFRGRPVAVMGASNGLGATRLAQVAWLPVFRALGMVPWFGRQVVVAEAAKLFDAEGNLVDPATREHVRKLVEGFAAFVAKPSSS